MRTKFLLLALLCLSSLSVMGQIPITRNKTKQEESKPEQTKPAEEAGYDVDFSCNVSTATMYIDGGSYGQPIGTCFLKTGGHQVRVTAFGYADYTTHIEVRRSSRSFNFSLKEMDAQALYSKGREYYDRKDYAEAVKWYRKSAEQGHAWSQCYLGECYYWGRGVTLDYAEAVKWSRKAAEQGNSSAQFRLGYCYQEGHGVSQDYAETVKWYRKSAEQGYMFAQNNLGICYEKGNGVPQDYAEAVKWYRKSAEQGYMYGQYNLGDCYENGKGVTQDYAEAAKWYKKAADQGHTGAKKGLERMEKKMAEMPTIGTSTYTPRVTTYTVNGVSFQMVEVEGGTFMMGATSEQGSDAMYDEKPAHRVTLSSYSIGETEVTQALWQAVMRRNPSNFKGDNLPVETVSWDDCQTFIRKLNQLTGRSFRLPTEAEWEYAARGGSKSRGYKYSGSNTLDNVAWYGENSGSKTHPVKGKNPNELGLYDMSGNVWEWCQDWDGSYSSGSQTNPTGPNSGSSRVSRGGGWCYYAWLCRTSDRFSSAPDDRLIFLGFRLVLSE